MSAPKWIIWVDRMLIAAGALQAEDDAKPMALDGTAEQPVAGGPAGDDVQNVQQGAANGTADAAAEQAAAAPPSEASKPGGRPGRATVSCLSLHHIQCKTESSTCQSTTIITGIEDNNQ